MVRPGLNMPGALEWGLGCKPAELRQRVQKTSGETKVSCWALIESEQAREDSRVVRGQNQREREMVANPGESEPSSSSGFLGKTKTHISHTKGECKEQKEPDFTMEDEQTGGG